MLRLALIGCTDEPFRLARIAGRVPGARCVAVVALDTSLAQPTAAVLGAAIVTSSVEALLTDYSTDFDAAVVLDPNRLTEPVCERLATAGKHLLVADPVGVDPATVRGLIAGCQSTGVRLMAAHEGRFLPSIRVVKESLDSGRLGIPGLLRIHRWSPPEPESIWRGLSRELDLACWLFGRTPQRVFALTRSLAGIGRDAPDFIQAHLGFDNGGMALIDVAGSLPSGDRYYSLSIIGSSGAAYADDHHDRQLLFASGGARALRTDQGTAYRAAMLREFVQSVLEGREPAVTGADALRALELTERCRQAAAATPVAA